ncbi:hypothetical protein BGX38DRAFT_1223917 [Terfezia claveryi]|nr:hypothetical protein BGX38DRAFT_1223917 [Terfezia claveryi]
METLKMVCAPPSDGTSGSLPPLPPDGHWDPYLPILPLDGSSKCSTPNELSRSSIPNGKRKGLNTPNDVAISTTLLAPGLTGANGVAQATLSSAHDCTGDVLPIILQESLRPYTYPSLSQQFFYQREILEDAYEQFLAGGTSNPRGAFRRKLARVEAMNGELLKNFETDMETKWHREKRKMETEWNREKTQMEHNLEMQVKRAENARDLLILEHKNAKVLLNNEIERLQEHNDYLEESKDRWVSVCLNNNAGHHSGGSEWVSQVSWAESWSNNAVEIGTQPALGHCNRLTEKEEQGLLALISTVRLNEDTPETICYLPVQAAVSGFVKNSRCYVTANKKDAPDIAICLADSNKPLKVLTCGIIQVKRPAEALDTVTNLSQLRDYILSLMQAQQRRTDFWGFLTNMKENILVEIERIGRKHHIIKYAPMSWPAVINYIRDATSSKGHSPPPLHFAEELGIIQDVVGSSMKWSLGEFLIPGDKTRTMVVKNSILSPPMDYHTDELKVLRHLTARRRIKEAPISILRLVWDPALKLGDDCYEFGDEYPWDSAMPRVQFGITPVGLPFDLAEFKTPGDFRVAMDSLLDGLDWLHTTARVIHRDIRAPNVIVDPSTKLPVIIDFDCAFQLPDFPRKEWTTYAGGLICVPPKVITLALKGFEAGYDSVIQDTVYEPEPSDDLVAFVLLVFDMLFPKQFSNFPAHRLKVNGSLEVVEAMSRFYKEVEASAMWGTLWANALEGNLEGLRRIRDFGLWPTTGITGS